MPFEGDRQLSPPFQCPVGLGEEVNGRNVQELLHVRIGLYGLGRRCGRWPG